MRADKDLRIFLGNSDWYKLKKNIGYIPTDKAPKEAVEAMKRYNERVKQEQR